MKKQEGFLNYDWEEATAKVWFEINKTNHTHRDTSGLAYWM